MYCCVISLLQDLVKVHKSLMLELQDSILNKNALNLYQIFISYKERYTSPPVPLLWEVHMI